MSTASPSWDLSRYVRGTIICRDQEVSPRTATTRLIDEVAGNLIGYGHENIRGYDPLTVRAILLDTTLTPPYPAQAPPQYAGR